MGRIVQFDQQSSSWLEWRLKGLGGSDAPVVMGVSPWRTPLQLWEEKTRRAQGQQTNWAMARGNNLEMKARAHYEVLNDIDMPPATMEDDEYPFMRVSLDGFNPERRRILEIKCPGKDDHELALQGKVPEKYVPQIQHALRVSGAEECHYWSFDGERGVPVVVGVDVDFQKRLIEAERRFWELVERDVAPEPTERDFLVLKDAASVERFERWKRAKLAAQAADDALEEIRAEILAAHTEPRIRCAGVDLVRSFRKGAVDYGKIPELKGVDLEQYRKAAVSTVDLRVRKGK